MSRESRLKRDLPVEIDLSALDELQKAVGATQKQMEMAYSRALRRTAVTLKKLAVREMKSGIAPRNVAMIRRRLLSFQQTRSGKSLDEIKLWFGLNAIKVKDLKGKIKGQRQRLTRDPVTGRFISPQKQAKKVLAVFVPAGDIPAQSYDDGVVGQASDGRRTIIIWDPVSRRRREAEVDIYATMLDRIEDNVFALAAEIFMHHFDVDIRGRVKTNNHSYRGR